MADSKDERVSAWIEGQVKALQNEDLEVRRMAPFALGETGDERAVEPLIETLKDEDWEVRRSAAKGLEKIGDERAQRALTEWRAG